MKCVPRAQFSSCRPEIFRRCYRYHNNFKTQFKKLIKIKLSPVIRTVVRDLETIIVLVSLAFSCIPHRLHHTLNMFRLRFIDSETAILSAGDGTTPTTVESEKLAFHYREKLCSVQEEQLRAQNTSLRQP